MPGWSWYNQVAGRHSGTAGSVEARVPVLRLRRAEPLGDGGHRNPAAITPQWFALEQTKGVAK